MTKVVSKTPGVASILRDIEGQSRAFTGSRAEVIALPEPASRDPVFGMSETALDLSQDDGPHDIFPAYEVSVKTSIAVSPALPTDGAETRSEIQAALFDWPVFAQRDVAVNQGAVTSVSGNLLINDYIRNPVDEIALVAGPRHGTVTLNDDGAFAYDLDLTDPDVVLMIAKGEVADSFVYRVDDTDGDSGYARVHLTLDVPEFGFSTNAVFGEVASAGDVNGDGIGDLLFGDADETVYLVFGNADGFDTHIDLEALDGTDGVKLSFDDSNLYLGTFVDSAGDINGDGIDDFLLGSFEFIDFFGPDAGKVFVVFGQKGSTPFGADFDLATLDGSNGFAITGYPSPNIGSYEPAQGVSILRGVGDLNGDGLNDFVVGTDPYSLTGVVTPDFVIYGSDEFDAELDLDSLDGTNGFAVESTLIDDVGDVNGDGHVDLLYLLEKQYSPDPDVYFIAFGSDEPASGAVMTEAEITSGGGAFITMGAFDYFTASLIGDVDGDGIDDVAVMSTGFDEATDYFGATYILYGADVSAELKFSIDVTETAGTMSTAIPHLTQYNQWSDIAAAGDINGDGIDDFLISETYADTSEGEGTGVVYLVFGQEGGLDAEFDLAALDGETGYVFVGAVDDGELGYGLSAAGDVNGDSHDDFIIQGGFHWEDFVIYGGPDRLGWMDAADGSLDGQIGIDLIYSGEEFF